MRPIDADALKAVFEEKSSEAVCGVKLCKAIISRIDEAPTVEAIPIEWIENYLRNYRYMAPIEKLFVREMIKAWEEREEQ